MKGTKPHHANLLVASPKQAEDYIERLYGYLGLGTSHNPDRLVFSSKVFGIDEARELRLFSGRKAFNKAQAGKNGKKVILITSDFITPEAQNALLKTFEDPAPDTFFFVVMRDENLLLPTLRSRMSVTRLHNHEDVRLEEVATFLSSPVKKRLSFSKKFVDEERNISVFLDDLLLFLRKNKEAKELIGKVYNVKKLVRGSSQASRLVMEHLSLVL